MATIRADISDGRRTYVQTSYGEPVVARLKALGAHWDAEKKCWWVGAAKRPDVEELLVESDRRQETGEEPAKVDEDLDAARVHTQVEYRGRR